MMKSLTISCKEATLAIVKKEESKISFSERIKLAVHLLICEFCKLFEKQNRFLSNNIKDIPLKDSLTADELAEMERKFEEKSK